MANFTLGELIELRRAYLLTNFQAYQGKDHTPATVVKSLNRAKRKIEKRLYLYDPKVTLHLHLDTVDYDFTNYGADTSANDVSKYVWHPQYVYINKYPLVMADRQSWGFWKPHEFMQHISDWHDTSTHPSDTPTIAVLFNERKIIIWPGASASAISSGNNYVSGFILTDDFTLTAAPGDEDDMDQTLTEIPRDLQEEVAVWSAMQDAHPTLVDTEQWRLFQSIRADAAAQIEEIGTRNKGQVDNANSIFQPMVSQVDHIGRSRYW